MAEEKQDRRNHLTEAPPSPLSSQPKRSEVEGSAVQPLSHGNVLEQTCRKPSPTLSTLWKLFACATHLREDSLELIESAPPWQARIYLFTLNTPLNGYPGGNLGVEGTDEVITARTP
jgi:hypothetical protein